MSGGAWRHFWRQCSKIWRFGDIFGENVARFGDFATFLATIWQDLAIWRHFWRKMNVLEI